MAQVLSRLRSNPEQQEQQQDSWALSYTPVTPVAAAYSRDPNTPDYRYQINQKLLYERRLPGGSYITAHVQRLQSGFYDSPVVHEDLIDNVRFVAINFVFHPSKNDNRFKGAEINIALHHNHDATSRDPFNNVPDYARRSIGKEPLPYQHNHGTQTAASVDRALDRTEDFHGRRLTKTKAVRPKFLRHAPHILYGSVSPETLNWNFSLAGSLGVSQGPVSASLKPKAGVKSSYKVYEMMEIQGSVRSLRSWFGHQYDVEDGELVWTLDENALQKSGLPREFTFVMLLTKGSGPVDTGLGDVVLDLDITPKVAGWLGTGTAYPGFITNTYRPIHRYTLNLDDEIGQRFEPELPGRGFNFAQLAASFDDFVFLPGTTSSTSDSGAGMWPSSMSQSKQQPVSSPQMQKQIQGSDGQNANSQQSPPTNGAPQALNLHVILENSTMSPGPRGGSQVNLRLKAPPRQRSPSYAPSASTSRRSRRRSITIRSSAPPNRARSMRDAGADTTSDVTPRSRHVSGKSQSHSLRRSRDHENLSGDYNSSPTEEKGRSIHRDVTSTPFGMQDYDDQEVHSDDDQARSIPDHMSTVSREALMDPLTPSQPRPMGDPQYRRLNNYTQQHLSSRSPQNMEEDDDVDTVTRDVASSPIGNDQPGQMGDPQYQTNSLNTQQHLTSQSIEPVANGAREMPADHVDEGVQTGEDQAALERSSTVARRLHPSLFDNASPTKDNSRYRAADSPVEQHDASQASPSEQQAPLFSRSLNEDASGLGQAPPMGETQYQTGDHQTQQELIPQSTDSDHGSPIVVSRTLSDAARNRGPRPMGDPQYQTSSRNTQQHLSSPIREQYQDNLAKQWFPRKSQQQQSHQIVQQNNTTSTRSNMRNVSPTPGSATNVPDTSGYQTSRDLGQATETQAGSFVTPQQPPDQTIDEPTQRSNSYSEDCDPRQQSRPATQQELDDHIRQHTESVARSLRPQTPPGGPSTSMGAKQRSLGTTGVGMQTETQQALDDQIRQHAESMARSLRPQTPVADRTTRTAQQQRSLNGTSAEPQSTSEAAQRRASLHQFVTGNSPPIRPQERPGSASSNSTASVGNGHATWDPRRSITITGPHSDFHTSNTQQSRRTSSITTARQATIPAQRPQTPPSQQQPDFAQQAARVAYAAAQPGSDAQPRSPTEVQIQPQRQLHTPEYLRQDRPQPLAQDGEQQQDSQKQYGSTDTQQWNDSPPEWHKLSPVRPDAGSQVGSRGGSKTHSRNGSAAVSRSSSVRKSGRYVYPGGPIVYGGTEAEAESEKGKVGMLRYGDEEGEEVETGETRNGIGKGKENETAKERYEGAGYGVEQEGENEGDLGNDDRGASGGSWADWYKELTTGRKTNVV